MPDWQPSRPEHREGQVDTSSEPRVQLREETIIVEVPRTPDRSNLLRCRARAKVIAAREGLRTEPEVISYEGRPFMGLLRDPQGWTFTFHKDPATVSGRARQRT
jgi:broad specificity phosphatase PhoE